MQKRVYELTVIMPEDKSEKEVEKKISDLLGKSGGKLTNHDFWGKKELVYPIKKQNRGVYGHFLVEMDTVEILDFQKRIKLDDEIMRHLLVVTNQQKKETKSKPKVAKK